MIVAALLLAVAGQDAVYVYVKRATREESRAASIEATIKDLPPVRLEGWKVLEGNVGSSLRAQGGGVDLSKEHPVEGGHRVRWKDGAAYADAAAHSMGTSTTWYRIVTAEESFDAAITIGTGKGWDCWVNGEAVSLATHNSTHLLPSRRLDFRASFRKGENHLLIELRGPTEFFFSFSRMGPELRIALERRLDADFPVPGSEQFYYRLEGVSFPKGIVLEVGGMTFTRDGTLVVCTRRGEIWRRRGEKWSLFASGLHDPLGLWAEDPEDVAIVQRTELTRVRDSDGDGTADLYEALSRGWETVARPTAYAFGLLKDGEGNWIGSVTAQSPPGGKYMGWCFKVSPRGEFVPWASGLRTPNGLGFDPSGEIFIADNQGEYVGTSALYHVEKGKFYGHPHSLAWHPDFAGRPGTPQIEELAPLRTPAAVHFPHGIMGRSPSQPLCDSTGGKFGPFQGQFFVGDQSSCFITRVGGRPYGLERVAWNGKTPFEIQSMSVTSEGFELLFTKPVTRAAAALSRTYSLQNYYYSYHSTYGSPQMDRTPAAVKEARVSEDGRRVTLVVGELVERRIYELHVRGLDAEDGSPLLHGDAYYTLNRRRSR